MNGKEKAILARYAHWQPALGKLAVPHRLPELLGVENGECDTGQCEVACSSDDLYSRRMPRLEETSV